MLFWKEVSSPEEPEAKVTGSTSTWSVQLRPWEKSQESEVDNALAQIQEQKRAAAAANQAAFEAAATNVPPHLQPEVDAGQVTPFQQLG